MNVSKEYLPRDQDVVTLSVHMKRILEGLGLYSDISESLQEHVEDTPYRIVKAFKEFMENWKKVPDPPTTFSLESDDIILVRDIEFCSVCMHHFLPFFGTMHVAYLPGERLLGLSKIPRIVQFFSKKPQIQELLVQEIADYIFKTKAAPKFCMVISSAIHTCCSTRGVRSTSPMVTSSIRYTKEVDKGCADSLKKEVLSLISISS